MPELALPLVPQALDFTCGAACFESMFRFLKGWSPGELHFARELGTLQTGFTPPEKIAELATHYGFDVLLRRGAAFTELRETFREGGVVFVTWWDDEAGHYSLVRAIGKSEIILMDPWSAREGRETRLVIEDFESRWKMRGAVYISVHAKESLSLGHVY